MGLFRPKEEWRRHVNPDGSIGGEVSSKAVVDPTAYIERSAVVMADAHVGPNEHVERGQIVLPGGLKAALT